MPRCETSLAVPTTTHMACVWTSWDVLHDEHTAHALHLCGHQSCRAHCRAMLMALAASSWCRRTAAQLSWTPRGVVQRRATTLPWRCLLLPMLVGTGMTAAWCGCPRLRKDGMPVMLRTDLTFLLSLCFR